MRPDDLVRAEHVWVTDVQVFGNVPHPGLLAEWRPAAAGGYEGLVIFVQKHPQGKGWSLTQKWMPADKIRRADPAEPPAAPSR